MATFFIDPYTKYYESLNNSGGMKEKLQLLIDNSTLLVNNISTLSSFVSSSTWKELGSTEITATNFPNIKEVLTSINTDISTHLQKAVNDAQTLLEKVKELKTKDEEYEKKKEELESLKRSEPTYADENGYESSAHSSWRNNVSTKENELKKLEEECKTLQDAAKALANGINAIEIEKVKEPTVVTTDVVPDNSTLVQAGVNTSTWTKDGITYIVPNGKISVGQYTKHTKSRGIYETTNYSRYGDHCLGFAYVHAYDIYSGNTKDNAESGYKYQHAGQFKGYTNDSKQAVLAKVYNEINSGRPVVLQVNGNKKGTSRHYVTVLGYNSNVKSANQLTEDDLIILDSYDGNVKRVGKNGSRFMVTGKACGKDYSGYQVYTIKA